jgi:hypothetical protein
VDPDLLLILPTATIIIVSLGGFLLVGWRMWLRRPQGAKAELSDQLREQMRAIVRDEIAVMMEERDGELEDLCERIDFAERFLVRARLPERDPERVPTPV